MLVVVPEYLRQELERRLDEQIALCPVAAVDRDELYRQLLAYVNEHGTIPDFSLAPPVEEVPPMTYRTIWERACAEGKGGMEDGRPWVDYEARPTPVMMCWDCLHDCESRGDVEFNRCWDADMTCSLNRRSFFWPSSEPLPEVDKP
jgi:hypothetical protein